MKDDESCVKEKMDWNKEDNEIEEVHLEELIFSLSEIKKLRKNETTIIVVEIWRGLWLKRKNVKNGLRN